MVPYDVNHEVLRLCYKFIGAGYQLVGIANQLVDTKHVVDVPVR